MFRMHSGTINQESQAADSEPPVMGDNTANVSCTLLFQAEENWRARPQPMPLPNGHSASVRLSRWADLTSDRTLEPTSDAEYDDHVLTLRLRKLRGELHIGKRLVWSGSSAPGHLFMTGPKQARWSAVIHGKYDHLRVFMPPPLLEECYEGIFGRVPSQPIVLFETSSVDDEALAQIAGAFQAAHAQGGAIALGLIDALGIAFASRLLAVHYQTPVLSETRSSRRGKPGLKRLFDYIDEHLSTPLYLSQLSEIAGMSRFQLARQFRDATGHPPYAYVVHRRIARAKELLCTTGSGIASVALEVGFSSQAHFTEAFRREVGMTPGEWRRANG